MDTRTFVRKNKLRLIFIPLGALAGFLYWRFIGCESGTCPIKSVWYWSTLYGMIFGFLIADLIQSYTRKKISDKSGAGDAGSKADS